MACHALGRCRICARRHKIDVFGSEKDQHYMIEKADLKLIILNTVCVVCIGKIERFVKKIDPDLIFGDYIKEQNLCEEETDMARQKISPKIVPTTDRRVNSDETPKSFGNTKAVEVDPLQPPKKPNWESEETDVTDGGNNLPASSTPPDARAKLAGTARPRFGGESGTSVPINLRPLVKSQPEKEALAKLVSILGVNGRKRPLDQSDESQMVKSAPSRTRKVGKDAGESKSLSSAESISEPAEIINEDFSMSSKKAGRYLVCDFCKKTFTHAGDLNKHRRKHTGEKPYECSQCQRKFAHASNLARHHRVHSGERPFLCPRCDRGFTRRDKLTIHVAGGRCQMNNSALNNAKSTVAVG